MYVLEAKGIMKTFPGVKALQDVDFALEPQEIHALMGENGAGKSTLVKVLTGVYQADGGTITIGDKVLQRIETTKQAFDLGISVIHQELNLLPHLDVATNIYIGRLPKTALGLVDWKKVHADADEVLRQVAADFDSHDIVRDLSVSQQQLVEIAKSVSRKAKILFFDEPTSSLTPAEVQNLFRIMRNLKEQGITMVYISHKLDEIEEIADRITVMRDGRKVMTKNMKDVSMDEIISAMVGGSSWWRSQSRSPARRRFCSLTSRRRLSPRPRCRTSSVSCGISRSRGSRWCTYPTSSTRSRRSPTGSRSCATGAR